MLRFSHHAIKALHHHHHHHHSLLYKFNLPRFLFQRCSFFTSHSHLLTLTSALKSLRQTQQSHAFALINGFLPHSVSLCASLILRYAIFHFPAPCCRLFEDTLPFICSAFLWNSLIRAFSIAGVNDNFRTYNRMVRHGVTPDDYTFPFVLKACADYLNVHKGMELHGFVFKLGFDLDIFVDNTLLLFYGNCGRLRDAKRVFDEMLERDIVSWNTVLGVLSVNGIYTESLGLFSDMNSRSECRPNMVSVISVLPVCAGLEDGLMTREVHCYVVKVGLNLQVRINNALVDAYGKCGMVESARQVFDEMFDRNEVSWNAIITSLTYLGLNRDALDMFRQMIYKKVKPNSVTISNMLPVLVELELSNFAKEIHGFSLRLGIECDVFIPNSLIDMYAKSGYSFKASYVFHQMAQKNVVSWNAMVANLAHNRHELAAIELVRQMQLDGEVPNMVTFVNILPACARASLVQSGKEIHAKSIRMGFHSDIVVSNALTDMYTKCGCLNHARNVFSVSLRDEVSYNILIVGYSQTTDSSESLKLFVEMVHMGLRHDVVSYMGAIAACANLAAMKQGKEIHGLAVRKHLHLHLFIANSLLDLYTKCGRIDHAHQIFNQIPNKDAASWNTMILGYGMLGEVEIAINLFEAMTEEGIKYDSVSYIAVLSACSHGGLVEKGMIYFEDMVAWDIKPTQMHYACMVDLLGRGGFLEESVKLIKSLPVEPDTNIWGALLGACRIHGNLELAHWATEHLFKLNPQHCGYYAILSNMYAEAGKWDEAKRVRELMKSKGARKIPGCSWVLVDNQVYAFVAGEKMEILDHHLWFAESKLNY